MLSVLHGPVQGSLHLGTPLSIRWGVGAGGRSTGELEEHPQGQEQGLSKDPARLLKQTFAF